jgi:hypothetical protein
MNAVEKTFLNLNLSFVEDAASRSICVARGSYISEVFLAPERHTMKTSVSLVFCHVINFLAPERHAMKSSVLLVYCHVINFTR